MISTFYSGDIAKAKKTGLHILRQLRMTCQLIHHGQIVDLQCVNELRNTFDKMYHQAFNSYRPYLQPKIQQLKRNLAEIPKDYKIKLQARVKCNAHLRP
jgi:hypothetical protein